MASTSCAVRFPVSTRTRPSRKRGSLCCNCPRFMDYHDVCLHFCPMPVSACSGTVYLEILVHTEVVTPPHLCYTCLGKALVLANFNPLRFGFLPLRQVQHQHSV